MLTGGRTLPILKRVGNYLMNENHPLVLVGTPLTPLPKPCLNLTHH